MPRRGPTSKASQAGRRLRRLLKRLNPWRALPAQVIRSNGTCVRIVPALMRTAPFVAGGVNADIGGGRFEDATELLAEAGVENVVFDPFNRSRRHNLRAAGRLSGGKAHTATVSNVLNVIGCRVARDRVIALAADAVGSSGEAFFQVYEGNKKGRGGKTPKGWQENRRLSSYLPEIGTHFRDVSLWRGMIRAKDPVGRPWRCGRRTFATLEQAIAVNGPDAELKRWSWKRKGWVRHRSAAN